MTFDSDSPPMANTASDNRTLKGFWITATNPKFHFFTWITFVISPIPCNQSVPLFNSVTLPLRPAVCRNGGISANHAGGADQRSFSFLDDRCAVLCDQDVLSCYSTLRAESLSTSGSWDERMAESGSCSRGREARNTGKQADCESGESKDRKTSGAPGTRWTTVLGDFCFMFKLYTQFNLILLVLAASSTLRLSGLKSKPHFERPFKCSCWLQLFLMHNKQSCTVFYYWKLRLSLAYKKIYLHVKKL